MHEGPLEQHAGVGRVCHFDFNGMASCTLQVDCETEDTEETGAGNCSSHSISEMKVEVEATTDPGG